MGRLSFCAWRADGIAQTSAAVSPGARQVGQAALEPGWGCITLLHGAAPLPPPTSQCLPMPTLLSVSQGGPRCVWLGPKADPMELS